MPTTVGKRRLALTMMAGPRSYVRDGESLAWVKYDALVSVYTRSVSVICRAISRVGKEV